MPRLYKTIDTLDNVGSSIKLNRFDGGLNTTDSNEVLLDSEAIIRQNWDSDGKGAIIKVNGFTKANATLIGAKPIRMLGRVYESDGTKKLIAICNGELHYSDDDGATFTQEGNSTAYTETDFLTGVNYGDYFYHTGLNENLHIFDPSDDTSVATTDQPTDPCRVLFKRSDRRLVALNNDVNSSTMYVSKVDPTNSADDWSAANDYCSIAVDGAKSEGLVSGATFGAYDLIFKDYATFKVWGYPTPQAVLIPGSPGCAAPYSVAQGDGLCFFLAHDGVWMWDGNKFYRISDPIKSLIDDINPSYVRNAFGVYRNRYYILTYTYTGQTTNKKTLIYDVTRSDPYSKRNVWFERPDLKITCPIVFKSRGDNNELYAGTSEDTGFVYRLDYSSTGKDDTSNITATYQTKYFNDGYPHLVKAFTRIRIRYFLNVGELLVYWYTDRGLNSGSFTMSTTQSGVALGTFVLGTDTLASDVEGTHSKRLPDNCIGKDISLKFYHKGNGVPPIIRDCKIDWEAMYED